MLNFIEFKYLNTFVTAKLKLLLLHVFKKKLLYKKIKLYNKIKLNYLYKNKI